MMQTIYTARLCLRSYPRGASSGVMLVGCRSGAGSRRRDRGAFLEVDLEYPAELHESHNDYPLCPERMPVPRSWLIPYLSKLVNEFEKDFYKLMNNAVFGKTMENLRERRDIQVLSELPRS